ncbi:MAG: class I SAM-dependent methyltransferase [Chloroflexia bacterium]|nr:class I SAM-dependent methyltransferase [Chloroflexia bacterium]
MKRAPLTHEPVFEDEAFAQRYAERHRNMAEKFGREYGDKLAARGFTRGRIIDVGCGFGAMNIVLARRFPDSEVVGIDLSEPLLELARQSARAAELGERVRFEKADAQQIPYEEDSFDAVISTNMVHIVSQPIQMLNEMERVLAPDGRLFIADIRRSWVGLLDKTFRSGLTLDEAREWVARSNLRQGQFSSSLLWWRFEA